MKLLLVHSAELALLIAAWAFLGRLLRGDFAAVVAANVNGYTVALLPVAESFVAIAFAIMAVYWLALVYAAGRDARAARAPTRLPPTFPTSIFYIGVYMFLLCCKLLLVGLAAATTFLVANAMNAAAVDAQFAANLDVLAPITEATGTFATAVGLLAGLAAFLLVELFGTVHALGWERAKAKYGVRKH